MNLRRMRFIVEMGAIVHYEVEAENSDDAVSRVRPAFDLHLSNHRYGMSRGAASVKGVVTRVASIIPLATFERETDALRKRIADLERDLESGREGVEAKNARIAQLERELQNVVSEAAQTLRSAADDIDPPDDPDED